MAYYNKVKIYGISQDPNTRDYIIIFNKDQYLENCCVRCEKYFTNMRYKWCKPCEISWLKENFTKWTSENEQIDNLIKKMQLGISNYKDLIFEWIPYYQFNEIKEIGKGGFSTVYSAIWKDFKVALKCLDNSQHSINELLNEV
jgi:hypothetical protein